MCGTTPSRLACAGSLTTKLLAAAVANVPPMRDTVTVLKRKVMAYVRGQAEQEAAVEEAAEARASEVAQVQGGPDVASR